MTTVLKDKASATAKWLEHEMLELLEREKAQRALALKRIPSIRVVHEGVDRPEEEVQCMHCNSYIYLSQIGCKCTNKVVCSDHLEEVRG
jgi:hypothetical protein